MNLHLHKTNCVTWYLGRDQTRSKTGKSIVNDFRSIAKHLPELILNF